MKMPKLCFFVFLISLVAAGCSKKPEQNAALSALSMEGEDKDVVTQTITSPEPQPQEQAMPAPAQNAPSPEAAAPAPEAVAPAPQPAVSTSARMEKNKQIQTALKNANLYFGEIDGKVGPLTRKAVEEFQKEKGLKVDGKVGPITWAELEKYLPGPKTKK